MQYNRIERHLIGNGLSGRFVRQTLNRLLKIELAYGFDLDILVGDDNMMTKTLVDLEWKMLYAEWSGKSVMIRNHNKQIVRRINVRYDVVGVQVSGDSPTEAMVAIAMSNGRTDLYKSSGQLVRRG